LGRFAQYPRASGDLEKFEMDGRDEPGHDEDEE